MTLVPLILPEFSRLTAGPQSGQRILHGFFSRQGGGSQGIYRALNCSLQSQDRREDVLQNRELVRRYFCHNFGSSGGGEDENAGQVQGQVQGQVRGQVQGQGVSLHSLRQIHSAECKTITELEAAEREQGICAAEELMGDGLVSDRPGEILAVLTADCAPVLFYGYKESGAAVIGAAHAGWQGALKGICEATLDAMLKLGAQKSSLCAAVGPCLGREDFAVSNDFPDQFFAQDAGAERFFKMMKGQLHFDFESYVADRLVKFGLDRQKIARAGQNTYALEDQYFSFRRATHRREPDYGRQISAIMIEM
ncbi:MAG: laccase domain-containing protein [Alphaproteobacteria bacterium]|nr:laccase domain-containing protein [Alphaproteobacteria bacterium]